MTTATVNQVGQLRVRNSRLNVLGTFARKMSFPPPTRLRSPFLLQWWEWGKLTGAVGVVFLALSFIAGRAPHPLVAGVLLHFTFDFTFQSPRMTQRKEKRGRHLLVHALAAGGFPPAMAGLVTGNPDTVITWAAIGTASHYAVDWTRKFGLQREALAVPLDQACHLLTILVLVLTG